MSDQSNTNGAASTRSPKRPSWYIPIEQKRPGDPTAQELLARLRIDVTLEDLGDAAGEIEAFLGQKFGKSPS